MLTGEDGMGKTSLAIVVSNERGVGLKEVDATTLVADGDLTKLLTDIRNNQVLFLRAFIDYEAIILGGLREYSMKASWKSQSARDQLRESS